MRVAIDLLGMQPDLGHHRLDLGLGRRRREVGLEGAQGLADDLAHGHARIERGEGILKDDLHLAPAQPHGFVAQAGEIVAEPYDTALDIRQQA